MAKSIYQQWKEGLITDEQRLAMTQQMAEEANAAEAAKAPIPTSTPTTTTPQTGAQSFQEAVAQVPGGVERLQETITNTGADITSAEDRANVLRSAFSDEELAVMGIDPNQLAQTIQQRDIAQQNLLATPQPTNTSLGVLQEALRIKSGVGNLELGQSELYSKLGIPTTGQAGMATLSQSLAERANEMQRMGQSFSQTVANIASAESDAYTLALNQYNLFNDQVTKAQDTMFEMYKYQTQSLIEKAQLKILENEANGIITDPIKLAELAALQQEYYQTTGTGQVYMPGTTGKYTVTQGNNSITVGVTDGQGFENGRGQCGEFVNDALGTKFSDLYTDKIKLINSSTPVVGAAFVMETNSIYGHVGIVESINADGTMNIVESNWTGDETVTRRTIPISAVTGFVIPSGSTLINTTESTSGDAVFDAYYQEFINKNFSEEKATEMAQEKVEEDEVKKETILAQVTENEVGIKAIDDIIEGLQTFTGGSTAGRTIGSLIPFFATQGKDIEAQLETIQGIVGFGKLQQMKNLAPTGASGLGMLNKSEMDMLTSIAGSLKISQSTDQFLENLLQVKQGLVKINNIAYEDFGIVVEDSIGDYDPYEAADEFDPVKTSILGDYNL